MHGTPTADSGRDDLLKGGADIKKTKGVQMGLGMSQEIDSNMVLRGLMWTHGASIQDVAPSAKIIMLTVSDEEADLYDAVKNGAAGYLLKDSSSDEVAQAIRVVAEGQSLISPSMAVKLLDEFKQMTRSDRQQVPTPRLTDRELEVLKLVAQGLNNREIAKRLFISENTVKNHVRNILEKLQLHSRMEAVMYAVREKLLDIP